MNCQEIHARLESTLLRDRDWQWLREAMRHAEQCPSCRARLAETHLLEQRLAALPAVEPSAAFLEAVMSRIAQPTPSAVRASRGSRWGLLQPAVVCLGALGLAVAYLFPAAGQSWLSNLWSSPRLTSGTGLVGYLSQHPPWAILLAGLATLLLVAGLTASDRSPEGALDGHS